MRKLIFVLSVIAFILVALMLVQAARAESAPEYGTCQVFSWQPDKLWFSWNQAPVGAARFEVSFFLRNTRTNEEIYTGSAYPPTFIGDTALILFDGVDFLRGEWIIRTLTCVARFPSGTTASVSNSGPWVMFHRWLPVVIK